MISKLNLLELKSLQIVNTCAGVSTVESKPELLDIIGLPVLILLLPF